MYFTITIVYLLHQSQVRIFLQVCNIFPGAGIEVIQADDFVAFIQQSLTQVRPEETGTTGDKDFMFTHWGLLIKPV